jgi:hypothetical protein
MAISEFADMSVLPKFWNGTNRRTAMINRGSG